MRRIETNDMDGDGGGAPGVTITSQAGMPPASRCAHRKLPDPSTPVRSSEGAAGEARPLILCAVAAKPN